MTVNGSSLSVYVLPILQAKAAMIAEHIVFQATLQYAREPLALSDTIDHPQDTLPIAIAFDSEGHRLICVGNRFEPVTGMHR